MFIRKLFQSYEFLNGYQEFQEVITISSSILSYKLESPLCKLPQKLGLIESFQIHPGQDVGDGVESGNFVYVLRCVCHYLLEGLVIDFVFWHI